MTDPTPHTTGQHTTSPLSRRRFIQATGGSALALGMGMTGCATETKPASQAGGGNGRAFRFAFMPDQHLWRDKGSPRGIAKSLDSLDRLNPRPDFIVTGGDLIHNCRDLASAGGRPTLIFGHFPPVSAISFFNGRAQVEEDAVCLAGSAMILLGPRS